MLATRYGKGTLMQHARHIRARATSAQAGELFSLPNSARARGIACISAPGTGKSTFFGRVLAFLDYVLERPQVIIDPTGGTIDQFLDQVASRLAFLPKSKRTAYWERIRYIDMGSPEFVCPFPLYYRLGTEQSLLEISERYLELILKSNPWLLTAQVLGWPPLHDVGAHTGMVLAALDLQITSAQDLLRHPEQWERRFTEAVERYPEAAPAVAYFRDTYLPMRPADRQRLTNPFFEKIFTFNLDPQLKAMFGSSKPGIDWDAVSAQNQTVLLDFRTVRGENRRFKLLWVFAYLYEWIKARGRREQPFGLIIDEFVALTQKVLAGENPLAVELDEFIQQYMRSSQIWLTIGFQSPHQLDEHLQQTVLSLGTYLIGQAATMAGARLLADAMFLRDPFRVKHYHLNFPPVPHWARGKLEAYLPIEEPVYLPLEEQTELFANRIRQLKQYQFLVRPAVSEGEISTNVFPISIRTVTHDPVTGEQQFPERERITEIRAILAAKSGRPVRELIQEQEQHRARYTQVVEGQLRQLRPGDKRATNSGTAAMSTEPQPPVLQPRPTVNRRSRIA
jgi:hypothetical protein